MYVKEDTKSFLLTRNRKTSIGHKLKFLSSLGISGGEGMVDRTFLPSTIFLLSKCLQTDIPRRAKCSLQNFRYAINIDISLMYIPVLSIYVCVMSTMPWSKVIRVGVQIDNMSSASICCHGSLTFCGCIVLTRDLSFRFHFFIRILGQHHFELIFNISVSRR